MKYLLLKHYRGGPPPAVDWAPMDQWTPEEVDAHVQYMRDFAARLEETGEFVDTQALAPEGAFVRYDGEGRPPVTDGPFVDKANGNRTACHGLPGTRGMCSRCRHRGREKPHLHRSVSCDGDMLQRGARRRDFG